MISPQFAPMVGGYEQACKRLSIALSARGHAVTVWAERRDRDWSKSEIIQGVEVRRWWCNYQRYFHTVTSLFGLAGYLLRLGRGYDVWHVHQYGLHSALTVAIGIVLRRPVVLKITSTSNSGIKNTLASGLFPRLISALHRRVDAIVALTRETAAEAEFFGIPRTRIHLLGNGVDTSTFRPYVDNKHHHLPSALASNDVELVIFVGRLTEEKNVLGLLRAWASALSELESKWTLVIIGDGPMRKELTDNVKALKLESSVHFVGHQTNISEWLSSASIFVLPSLYEGLSNALLEAMSSGLPVVVTRVSGATELVEDTGSGKVVPIADDESLASAIKDLANSKELRFEMGARGRFVIQNRYAVEHVASLHERMYERIVNHT